MGTFGLETMLPAPNISGYRKGTLTLVTTHMLCVSARTARYPSSTLLPFLVGGILIKTEQWEKGYPSYEGFTGEPGQRESSIERDGGAAKSVGSFARCGHASSSHASGNSCAGKPRRIVMFRV